jgi:hypothetical protein
MLKKMSTIISLLLLASVFHIFTDEDFEFEGDVSFSKPYMFISLGHSCLQAQATRVIEGADPILLAEGAYLNRAEELEETRANGLRDAAFPFDWLTTCDVDKLILCLDENFEYFLDETYFIRELPIHLENVRYGCRFTHDWPYHGNHLDEERHKGQLAYIKQKYARRIARFANLRNYKGKVFFMRTYNFIADYQNQSSRKIRDALKRFFPDLNFTLVIVNWTDDSIFKEGFIEGVKEYFRPGLADWEEYALIYDDLLKKNGFR